MRTQCFVGITCMPNLPSFRVSLFRGERPGIQTRYRFNYKWMIFALTKHYIDLTNVPSVDNTLTMIDKLSLYTQVHKRNVDIDTRLFVEALVIPNICYFDNVVFWYDKNETNHCENV